jgi:tetratricopeptide (TPR) repeat protein
MGSAASASEGGASTSTGRTHPSGVIIAGRFRIEASLGRGATGSVYRVRDEHSGKKLALKQLRVANAESSELLASQFEREYHTLCHLAHPSIIEVYDYGLDNDDPFYTMELLDGEDLRERGRTTWRQACGLLRDVASSLAILHSRRLLHRDISTRNVRCTGDGRAKLIDFGAMMPMGVAKHVFGTPPFVPPEALQLQALDARADLYALGALAYHMLTGSYAYTARTLEQLPEAWQTRPQSPRVVAREIPIALEELVMQLMQLDRAHRPASAAEVMERLSGIAGTPLVERVEVTRAYLATPVLVGRDAPLQRVREHLSAAVRGQGGSFVIEGAPGVGRSRFLDACVLEAKLLGCVVLRGDASDSTNGDYGLTKSLFAQLFRALPDLVERHARPSHSILCHMLPRLDPERAKSQPLPERRHLQAAVRDFLLSIARSKRLVIAVDDADRSDEPSAALLAALAHGAMRRSLSLLMTTDATLRPSSAPAPARPQGELAPAHAPVDLASLHALEVARELGHAVQLSSLAPEQTESLVRSLFGDVDHVAALASRIHGLSQGNPRAAMALAEHLVERGVARYEAGSWALPAELIAGDLPESLAAELSARVSALPADARELAETLALTDPEVFSPEDYRTLTEHGDRGRTYRALDALLAAAILVPSGTRHRFAQRELVDLLCAAQSPERARALHERIASAVKGCDEPALYPHHLLLAGRAREAIAHLLPLRSDPRQFSSLALALSLLERAVLASQQLQLPLRVQFDLRAWLMNVAAYVGQDEIFGTHYALVLSRCEQDSGLCDYAALGHLPPDARLAEALTRAEQRYRATPEAERGLSPIEAIAQLGRLCGTVVIMASVLQDIELVARLPSLLPFAKLGPGLLVVQGLVDGMLDFQGGRIDDASQKYADVLARIDRPDRGGIEEVQFKAIRLGVLYMQGVIAAARGQASALEWVAELEQEPGYRENAWRVRRTYELMRGDDEAALQCRRRAELFALQDGQHQHFPGTPARIELLAHTYRDNLLGVKRAMERLESSAARYRGWRPTFAVARAQYRRLQGDSLGALEALAPALEGTAPGRHLDWGLTVSTHVVLLNELGRRQQAIELGFHYLEVWRNERLQRSPSYRTMQRSLSDALMHLGRLEEAVRIADDGIRESLESGVSGFFLGLAYEARARVAIAMGDHAAAREFADRCAHEAKRGRSQGLSAKYERLLQEAHSSGITLTNHLALLRATPDSIAAHSARTAHDRLLECVDDRERTRIGLRLLLEACAAQSGFLFGLRDGRFTLLASSESTPPTQELFDLLDAHLRSLLAAEHRKTQQPITGSAGSESQRLRFVDADGRRFEPLLIASRQHGDAVLGALAALCYTGDERSVPSRELLEAVAAALLDHDDVDAVTCIA